MPRDDQKSPFPLRVRIVQWCFLGAAVVATLCLGWWQWGRWHDSDGSFQNLGYALQWPIFGIFFIVAYRKYMEYERDRADGDIAPAAPASIDPTQFTELPASLLPQTPAQRISDTASNTACDTSDSGDSVTDIFTDDRRQRSRAARRNQNTQHPDENRIP